MSDEQFDRTAQKYINAKSTKELEPLSNYFFEVASNDIVFYLRKCVELMRRKSNHDIALGGMLLTQLFKNNLIYQASPESLNQCFKDLLKVIIGNSENDRRTKQIICTCVGALATVTEPIIPKLQQLSAMTTKYRKFAGGVKVEVTAEKEYGHSWYFALTELIGYCQRSRLLEDPQKFEEVYNQLKNILKGQQTDFTDLVSEGLRQYINAIGALIKLYQKRLAIKQLSDIDFFLKVLSPLTEKATSATYEPLRDCYKDIFLNPQLNIKAEHITHLFSITKQTFSANAEFLELWTQIFKDRWATFSTSLKRTLQTVSVELTWYLASNLRFFDNPRKDRHREAALSMETLHFMSSIFGGSLYVDQFMKALSEMRVHEHSASELAIYTVSNLFIENSNLATSLRDALNKTVGYLINEIKVPAPKEFSEWSLMEMVFLLVRCVLTGSRTLTFAQSMDNDLVNDLYILVITTVQKTKKRRIIKEAEQMIPILIASRGTSNQPFASTTMRKIVDICNESLFTASQSEGDEVRRDILMNIIQVLGKFLNASNSVQMLNSLLTVKIDMEKFRQYQADAIARLVEMLLVKGLSQMFEQQILSAMKWCAHFALQVKNDGLLKCVAKCIPRVREFDIASQDLLQNIVKVFKDNKKKDGYIQMSVELFSKNFFSEVNISHLISNFCEVLRSNKYLIDTKITYLKAIAYKIKRLNTLFAPFVEILESNLIHVYDLLEPLTKGKEPDGSGRDYFDLKENVLTCLLMFAWYISFTKESGSELTLRHSGAVKLTKMFLDRPITNDSKKPSNWYQTHELLSLTYIMLFAMHLSSDDRGYLTDQILNRLPELQSFLKSNMFSDKFWLLFVRVRMQCTNFTVYTA